MGMFDDGKFGDGTLVMGHLVMGRFVNSPVSLCICTVLYIYIDETNITF